MDFKVMPITDGKRYGTFREAQAAAERDFPRWFPLADPKHGVLVFDNGDGSGFLQASYRTAEGGFVSEIEFKDFRPFRRIESAEARVEMCPS